MAYAPSRISSPPPSPCEISLPLSQEKQPLTTPVEEITSLNSTLSLQQTSVPSSLEQLVNECLKIHCVIFGQDCRPLFSFLNNDFPSPFEFGGLNYTCAASAYEAQKFLGCPNLMQRFTTLDAQQAFALSAEKHLEKTPFWYERREDTMYHVLRAKFGQNPHLMRMLLMTADAYLSFYTPYKNMDSFWTNNGDGSGKNRLGDLLMIVRSENGGTGQVAAPANHKGLLEAQKSQQAVAHCLEKSDQDILAEIEELNRRINEEEYRLNSQIARRKENQIFTRFRFNNFPHDKTLVPLSSGRFINASFVLGKEFIGTQSPMEHTKADFWAMVLEHHVPVVIMLNRLGDPGDEIYFPFALNDKKKYGDIHLELIQEPIFTTDLSWRQSPHEEEPHAIIHRKIKIRRENEDSRIVDHFQYQNWRDFSAGNERATACLVQTVNPIRIKNHGGPTVIHCHAGVGRTSVMITLLKESLNLSSGAVDIKRNVERQRSSDEGRCNSMMQAKDQYHFCYRVLRLLSTA